MTQVKEINIRLFDICCKIPLKQISGFIILGLNSQNFNFSTCVTIQHMLNLLFLFTSQKKNTRLIYVVLTAIAAWYFHMIIEHISFLFSGIIFSCFLLPIFSWNIWVLYYWFSPLSFLMSFYYKHFLSNTKVEGILN